MKKILSVISALALVTAVSCSSKPSEESAVKREIQTYNAEKLSDVANYRKQNIDIPSDMRQMWSFMPYNNGTEYLLLGSGDTIPAFWKANSSFTEYETIDFPEFDVGRAYDLDTANDGTIVTFVNHTDEEPDENGEYPENAEYRFMIKTYKDGKLASSANAGDFGVTADESMSVNGVCSDGSIVIALISGAYEMFNIDGSYIGTLSADDGDINTIGKCMDGRLICSVAYKEGDTDKLKICLINADGTLTDYNSAVYDFAETPQGIQQGAGDYDFFLWSRSTIFGIKPDGEIVSLFNINVSGMTSDVIDGFFVTDSGNMAVVSNDYSSYSVSFKEYIPRTVEEMDGIPTLTLGVIGDGENETNRFVVPWNDGGNDFILETKSYDLEINSNGLAEVGELQEDILSGNMPDILIMGGGFNRLNLGEKGMLCDLYEFIDNDDVYTRDYFAPNVLECFETDGKLYSLPNSFFLEAGQVAKTKFVGDGSDWDFDKYVDMIVNPPVDVEIQYDSKYARLAQLSYTDWIDFDNYTCHFTDNSFVKFLKWCNEAEALENYPTSEEVNERSYEEEEAEYITQSRKYIDNKAVFDSFTWVRYGNYVEDTRGAFNGEEITYLETPSLIGNDSLAISATSEYKELAWEYVKSRCSDDFYKTSGSGAMILFPVTKSGLEYKADYERNNYTDYSQYDEITDPEWKNYKGLTYQLGWSIYKNAIQLGELTDEDVQFVNDMIARAEPSDEDSTALGFDFYSIVEEEIGIFFNGDTTAEQCAEIIQNRAGIYLSEQFG